MERHAVKCESWADTRAVLANRGVMKACWAIARDETGAEAEYHLAPFADRYVQLTLTAALRLGESPRRRRTWKDWPARAVVAVAVFLAYTCMPDTHRGRARYRVAGFTMGFLRMLVSIQVQQHGKAERIEPGRSTLGHLSRKGGDRASDAFHGWLGDLLRVGLVAEAHQYDAAKVAPHLRGPRRVDSQGNVTQWAFNQFYLDVRPWKTDRAPLLRMRPRERRMRVRGLGISALEYIERKRRARERAEADAAAAEYSITTPEEKRQWEPVDADTAARLQGMGIKLGPALLGDLPPRAPP